MWLHTVFMEFEKVTEPCFGPMVVYGVVVFLLLVLILSFGVNIALTNATVCLSYKLRVMRDRIKQHQSGKKYTLTLDEVSITWLYIHHNIICVYASDCHTISVQEEETVAVTMESTSSHPCNMLSETKTESDSEYPIAVAHSQTASDHSYQSLLFETSDYMNMYSTLSNRRMLNT